MPDRLITLGTADASLEARQANELATLKRRLSALERTNYQPPVGTIFPYAAYCANINGDGVTLDYNASWYTTGGYPAKLGANTTQLAYTTGQTWHYNWDGYSITISTKAGGGPAFVGNPFVVATYTSQIAMDLNYFYYIDPDTGALFRKTTAGAGTTQLQTAPSGIGNYADMAVTPTAAGGTPYVYVVGTNGNLYRKDTSTGAWTTQITASSVGGVGWSATDVAVNGAASGTAAAGDVFLARAGTNDIVRCAATASNPSGAALTTIATADGPIKSIDVSDSHIYWATANGISRIQTDGAGESQNFAVIANVNDIAVQPSLSTAATLYYTTSVGTSIGVINNAESAGSTPDAPEGFALCDGTAISRETYAALYATIGTTYGIGDGSTTFNLPNFLGRVPMGAGTGAQDGVDSRGAITGGAALTPRLLGAFGGKQTHTLVEAEIPNHRHSITLYSRTNFNATGSTPGSNLAASGNTEYTNYTGGGGSHNNVQPFTVVNYIIKY